MVLKGARSTRKLLTYLLGFSVLCAAFPVGAEAKDCLKFGELELISRNDLPYNIFYEFEDLTIEERYVRVRCEIEESGRFNHCVVVEKIRGDDINDFIMVRYLESYVVGLRHRIDGASVVGRCVDTEFRFGYYDGQG